MCMMSDMDKRQTHWANVQNEVDHIAENWVYKLKPIIATAYWHKKSIMMVQ